MRKILLLALLLSTSFQFLLAQSNLEFHHVNKDISFSEDESIQIDFYKSKKEGFVSKSAEFGETPDWKWKSKFGGTGFDFARDIVTDSNGNVYN